MPFDEHAGSDIRRVVDEQPIAPGRDDHVALDAALRDRLLEQAEPLRDRQHRLLARVVHDEHVQLVVERRRTTDDVEMAEGRRVEGSRDDGDPAAHAASLSSRDP